MKGESEIFHGSVIQVHCDQLLAVLDLTHKVSIAPVMHNVHKALFFLDLWKMFSLEKVKEVYALLHIHTFSYHLCSCKRLASVFFFQSRGILRTWISAPIQATGNDKQLFKKLL